MNRFIAEVAIQDQLVEAHIANTGRMKELLIPGAYCYLKAATHAKRKTAWDLFLIESPSGDLVCLQAVFANKMLSVWLAEGRLPFLDQMTAIKPEVVVAGHRYDFWVETKQGPWVIEVKSVNLIENGVARFPDAPTSRGVAHVQGLLAARATGQQVAIVFIGMGRRFEKFKLHKAHDPAFADIMWQAHQAGIPIYVIESDIRREGALFSRLLTIDWENG